MIYLGFSVVQKKGLDYTVKFLKRVHQRLLRRSFPTKFVSRTDGNNEIDKESAEMYQRGETMGTTKEMRNDEVGRG